MICELEYEHRQAKAKIENFEFPGKVHNEAHYLSSLLHAVPVSTDWQRPNLKGVIFFKIEIQTSKA
jgi:hypothetical protein